MWPHRRAPVASGSTRVDGASPLRSCRFAPHRFGMGSPGSPSSRDIGRSRPFTTEDTKEHKGSNKSETLPQINADKRRSESAISQNNNKSKTIDHRGHEGTQRDSRENSLHLHLCCMHPRGSLFLSLRSTPLWDGIAVIARHRRHRKNKHKVPHPCCHPNARSVRRGPRLPPQRTKRAPGTPVHALMNERVR